MLTTLPLATSCITETWISTRGETDSGIVLGNPSDPSCWPAAGDLSTTLSPAICPEGYTSACDATPTRDISETVWACCPSGFRCDGGYWSCLSDATAGKTTSYIATDTDRLGQTSTRLWITDSGINAHSIRVAFHSSDLPVATYSPTDASSPTSDTAPATSSPGNLSPGTKAGVGVGVAVGSFLLLSGVAWMVWRWYRSRSQAIATTDGQESHRPSSRSSPNSNPTGPPTTQVGEMDSSPGVHELETKAAREPPANETVSYTNG